MQAVSTQFDDYAKGYVRPITWRFDASFDKTLDPSIQFFTLDESILDGTDLLAPADSEILAEWNKYTYTDYSDRVINVEWVQEFDFFYSMTSAMADITLNNYDDLFTKNSSSPLSDDLLPRRPIRIQAGFGIENIPQFVGLTEKAPVVDRKSKTATIHAVDFLSYLFTRKLDQSVMYIDKRVDEILHDLYVAYGVPSDMLLFEEAQTTIPYSFFTKDMTIGDATKELIIAELGSIYMNEEGFIVFKNRIRVLGSPVYTFDNTNVIDYDNSDETKIINSVSVKGEVREEQPLQIVFNLATTISPFLLEAGQTVTKFFEMTDPATSIEPITSYSANSDVDGGGTDLTGDISIVDQELFSDVVMVEIENTGATDAYITGLTVDGTPVQVVKVIDVVEKDADSIEQYEEQTYEIKSKYIQDEETAVALALQTILRFKDYGNTLTMTVKGNMALQINDVVSVDVDDITDDFVVMKIENNIDGKFNQRLTVQKYSTVDYFTLDVSVLDGEDVLSP